MAVDLGFIDESTKLLESRFFPSKIGGKPAWLNLEHIPPTEEVVCTTCNSPMYFLCQLYCPLNEKDTAFHRTIFVFLCTTKDCFHPNMNSNFVVFRNQLSKSNPYYPETPPCDDLTWRPDITAAKFGTELCAVCGIRSGDREKNYCSTEHKNWSTKGGYLLPEYGLSIEPESECGSDTSSGESEDDEQQSESMNFGNDPQLTDFHRIASAQDDPTVEQIFSECSEKVQDEVFTHFKECIKSQPEQVVRYDRGGEPLWLSEEHVPTSETIPNCEYCGQRRTLEFQILPQLLNHLNLDHADDCGAGSLDWGTLAVYTCRDSCDSGPAYKREFLWKQDILH